MTDKRRKATKVKYKHNESTTNIYYWWNAFFFRRHISVFLKFDHRRTQNFTIINQEKPKIPQIHYLKPHDYQINYVNFDLCHQYWIPVAQTSFLWNIPICDKRGETAIFACSTWSSFLSVIYAIDRRLITGGKSVLDGFSVQRSGV